ncbi:hypothetical protein [Salicola sp. Rm-C-2C1-2]|uniref:hypothetical protein n=1 Tax=Salicola sp. Rm-C-2C1-2 TaxID=3141321 RepID=UPI0032E52743
MPAQNLAASLVTSQLCQFRPESTAEKDRVAGPTLVRRTHDTGFSGLVNKACKGAFSDPRHIAQANGEGRCFFPLKGVHSIRYAAAHTSARIRGPDNPGSLGQLKVCRCVSGAEHDPNITEACLQALNSCGQQRAPIGKRREAFVPIAETPGGASGHHEGNHSSALKPVSGRRLSRHQPASWSATGSWRMRSPVAA